jgi:plasmid maintenance system killer protein
MPSDIQSIAKRKLNMLEAAECLNDLRIPPNNRLEALSGSRKGQYSIGFVLSIKIIGHLKLKLLIIIKEN